MSIFSALTSPIASVIGSGLSFLGGQSQNVASAKAAQAQMDFQREMSDTSYQRQVKDLTAAGINPMLVTKLGGASTPPGAMPSFVNPAAMASQSFSAIQSSSAAKQQAETSERMTDEQIKNVNAMTDKIREEIKNIPIEGQRLQALVYQIARYEDLLGQQAYTEQDKQRMLRATVQKLSSETDLLQGSVQAMNALDNLGKQAEALRPIVDVIKSVIGRK